MLEQEQELLTTLEGKMIDIALIEDVDSRLRRLATNGLIAKDELALFVKLMKDLEAEKKPTITQRLMIMRIFDKLLKLIMDNKEVYQRVLASVKKKKKSQKEAFDASHTIVDHEGKRYYIDENEQLIPYNSKIEEELPSPSFKVTKKLGQLGSKKPLQRKHLQVRTPTAVVAVRG
jgi:hypothetical protein